MTNGILTAGTSCHSKTASASRSFRKKATATLRARKSPPRESLERVCATLVHLWQAAGSAPPRHQHRYIHRRAHRCCSDARKGPDNLLERNPTTCRRGSVGYPYNRPSAAFSFDGGGSELLRSKTSNCQKSVHLVFKKYSMSNNTQLPEHPELDEDPSAFDFRKVTAIEHKCCICNLFLSHSKTTQ